MVSSISSMLCLIFMVRLFVRGQLLMSGVARSEASASAWFYPCLRAYSPLSDFRDDVFESKPRIGISLGHSSTAFISRSARLLSPYLYLNELDRYMLADISAAERFGWAAG